MNIRGDGHYALNQLGFTVDPNVGLHSKVPLITFSGRLHFRVTLLFPILGRARSGD